MVTDGDCRLKTFEMGMGDDGGCLSARSRDDVSIGKDQCFLPGVAQDDSFTGIYVVLLS